jgi:hypothetical protein
MNKYGEITQATQKPNAASRNANNKNRCENYGKDRALLKDAYHNNCSEYNSDACSKNFWSFINQSWILILNGRQ